MDPRPIGFKSLIFNAVHVAYPLVILECDNENMDPKIFSHMAEAEKSHWWFVARRKIIDAVITRLSLDPQADIFEAGCGTGGNLEMLSRHGSVFAMELDEYARQKASAREAAVVEKGRLAEDIPFPSKKFDLITMLDVLEHLEEDGPALVALREKLKPGGRLLLTVPAYKFLWSHHDTQHHHFRRYNRGDLINTVKAAGYEVQYSSYFNFWISPLIITIRLLQKLLGKNDGDDMNIPPFGLNGLFTSIFGSERFVLGRALLPFGISIILIARN